MSKEALSHILEPIVNHNLELLERVAVELKESHYTCELSQYHIPEGFVGRQAVGEMLYRAIMYLIDKGLKVNNGN